MPLTRQTQSLRLIFTISPLKASTFISILWPPASWLDLPDIVVELNLLDGCDAPVEGHVAYVIDSEVLGARRTGQQGAGKREENDPQESTHNGVPLRRLGMMDGSPEPISVARVCLARGTREA